MSIIDSGCLPLRIIPERICSSSSLFLFRYIYIYNVCICMCVCPSAIANMEVSMSLVYLKENRRINEGCFVYKTIYSNRNTDLNVEVIIDNCITRTMTLYLSFILFHMLTFSAKHIQARQSSICLIISNIEKNERDRERTICDRTRSLACSWTREEEEDSRGNTWYFVLRSSQVFKIIR